MSKKEPTLAQWKKLYSLMQEIRDFSPWDFIEESDLFAVEDSESKEIGFVSIMGGIGEHYSIAVYRGEEALNGFRDLCETDPNDDSVHQQILEISNLQASFEDREYIADEDRQIIRKLGLSFRGKNEWPMFRSYHPGHVPWFIDGDEARFLIQALEQTLEVIPRFEENPSIIDPDEEGGFLIRRMVTKGGKSKWIDSVWYETDEYSDQIEFYPDMIALSKIEKKSMGTFSVEMDIFISPAPVQENDEIPYFPYILLMVDVEQGTIVSHELIPPVPDLKTMWKKMPAHITNAILTLPAMPEEIYVTSFDLYDALVYMKAGLKSTVFLAEELINIPEIRNHIFQLNQQQ